MAGLPGGTLVARGDRFWGHPSPTVEPDQNKGRSPGSRGGSAVLGQPREQWPSVFPAQPACQQFTRSGGPEGELGPRKRGWSGAGHRKGAISPTEGWRGQRSRGRDAGGHTALVAVAPGDPHLARHGHFACLFLSPANRPPRGCSNPCFSVGKTEAQANEGFAQKSRGARYPGLLFRVPGHITT